MSHITGYPQPVAIERLDFIFDSAANTDENLWMSMPARPDLRFETFSDLLADVDRLRSGPYEKFGRWDLGTILDHVAKSIGTPFMPGRKNLPWPAGPVARFCTGRFVKLKRYPSITLPVPKMIRPNKETAVETGYAELISSIAKFQAEPGPSINVPPIGKLDLKVFTRIQLMHAEHHLGFLKPGTGTGDKLDFRPS